ncbi:MAG: M20 family metallopeptidase [Gammaproteobacteria bacterium]|nr:M20 family metallopeptidase [Gammaproteobacteria bacterium]MYA37422.1 amidohydrolase [Gammaproteobacteria bacterium]MYH86749.1 amidohydrolase [Gammaproteobacteria bacterium]MYK04906.1 amidohydrolase [Gammaproteobacteria bacterium]
MTNPDLTAFRRDLHKHPETGFELARTAGVIADKLEQAGLEVRRGIGGAGIVASLRRGADESAIGLRADMDALPITEKNGFPHCSVHAGKFHGCGHDGHSTMLVGAALELARDDSLARTVHFIFQPDEENGTGAAAMIADGLFERFPMREIYGLHNLPGMTAGNFAVKAGPFCAFEDNFEITITGRGGHSSMPEKGIDPIVVAGSVIMQLQSIVSRNVSAADRAVVSVTGIQTDGARNIIPDTVVITGDCRGFERHVSRKISERMNEIVQGACAAHGAKREVSYSTSFRPLVNDAECTEIIADAAAGVSEVDRDYGPVTFSEDFAEFLQHCPGAFILLGNGTEGAHGMSLHNPAYDFNDEIIRTGVDFWKTLALSRQGA